jgi:hypothetical protein
MTIVDPNQRLAAAVRQQLGALGEQAAAKTASSTAGAGVRRNPHTVSLAMAERIRAIAPDDPDGRRKAVRIYLESELAREFGPRLLNDPGFPAMLDAVQQRMAEDAQAAAAVEALGQMLVAGRVAAS